jgi:hypothetical protein
MLRKLLFSHLVLIFLLAIVPTSSANLELEAVEKEKAVYLGDEVSFELIITKLGALHDRVFLTVSGEPQEWVVDVPGFVDVPSQEETKTLVTFFPTGEIPGTFTYTVTVTSYFTSISASDEVALKVQRPLDIEDFSASKSGDELLLNILLKAKSPREAEMSFVITNYRGDVIREFSLTSIVDTLTPVEERVDLPKDMLAGDYNVEVTLVGTPVKKNYMFTVMPVHKVTEMVHKTSSAMYDEFEIIIVNEGNIKEPQYVTYKTYPNSDWITGLITEPDTCFLRDGQKTCKYVFSDLAPGDSATLSYRLDYWSIYAGVILVLVTIFMVVFFTMRRATAPVIIKRHVRRGSDRHHVVLEVRNPFYHSLSNSIVRDWVSPLANVIHHEIDMVKPLIRRSNAGTELIWKLGDIKPKETRIISYPIKTLVQGSLKMPKAYIRYNKPNGRIRRLFSRPIVIEA